MNVFGKCYTDVQIKLFINREREPSKYELIILSNFLLIGKIQFQFSGKTKGLMSVKEEKYGKERKR